MWIYVLELKNGYYYVGRTDSLQERIRFHYSGMGSTWTQLHPPVSLIEHFQDKGFDELATTLRYMKLYGVDMVRGAIYSKPTLTSAQKREIQLHFWAEDDLCISCGGFDHYHTDCPVIKNTLWNRLTRCFNSHPTLTFGRHSGSTYQYVYDNHPEYCQWILSNHSHYREYNQFKKWLLEK